MNFDVKNKLTNRMKMVADLVPEGASVADIGCDHAYLSIYLADYRHCSPVYAMDVKEGPLAQAKQNIKQAGLEDRIVVRRSDGFEKLEVGEADCVLMSGMGGLLMIEILGQKIELVAELDSLVLQPQTDAEAVRKFVHQNGFEITREAMLYEEDKPYVAFRCENTLTDQNLASISESWTPVEYIYGKGLLAAKNSALYEYLCREKRLQQELHEKLTETLANASTERTKSRLAELELAMAYNVQALAYYKK